MEKRRLGKTGLSVTPLGFGSAQIGFLELTQEDAAAVLNGILDTGINVIDTASCYGDSEEKIGKAISSRRKEYVLVSKCGHRGGDTKLAEWSPELVRFSAERSLKRMKTDWLDVLLLHSCSLEDLRREELISALQQCKRDGMVRYIGYSGDREEFQAATGMDVFDCVETSVSFCDQQILKSALPSAKDKNLGVFAKRSLANTCWRDLSGYKGYQDYTKAYTERLKAMGFTPESLGFDGDWVELALRFTVFQPGVHCALIGGINLGHVRNNTGIVSKGTAPGKCDREASPGLGRARRWQLGGAELGGGCNLA